MSLIKLLRLADCDQIPADCRQWFRDGVSRYIDGNEKLDDCLDLKQEGVQIFEIRRDRHLRRAASHLDAASPWRRAVMLSQEVNRFEAVIWPRWKLKPEPPTDASQLRKHLFLARREKAIPRSPRQIHRILIE